MWGTPDETYAVHAELVLGRGRPTGSPGDNDLPMHRKVVGRAKVVPSRRRPDLAQLGLPDRGVTLVEDDLTPQIETTSSSTRVKGPRAVHFQEWWVRMRAAVPAERFVVAGMDRATPAPGVLDVIRTADVVLLPPSNPVVSIGIILGVPGVRDALRGTRAPVVGVSPCRVAPCAGMPMPA